MCKIIIESEWNLERLGNIPEIIQFIEFYEKQFDNIRYIWKKGTRKIEIYWYDKKVSETKIGNPRLPITMWDFKKYIFEILEKKRYALQLEMIGDGTSP
jgi:hypothetical protein